MLKRSDYPKQLHIGTEIYKVKFVRRFKERGTLAECDPSDKEIRILCGQGPEETLKCLIHEIGHAMFQFENDLEVKHKFIYAMEDVIYQFLRDNVFIRSKGQS